MVYKKKLIEVALPLKAINEASAREKSIRHGHPSTLHLWWARRPLAAARAVIFSQMVDDPSEHPEEFPTEESQELERQRLFRLIEELVLWENTTNEKVLNQAREEIWKSWRSTCEENKDHPQAVELFNPEKLPAFHDPFAGGGALPLEAQRLGLESYASDLNPVAVLINKAMIEIPPKFTNKSPVNPEARKQKGITTGGWKGAQVLAEDVRYYGQWMRDEAEKRIGYLYPKVDITEEIVQERPDLKPYIGQKLTAIAWLWARTVKCPNPACGCEMPLISSFVLSSKKGNEWHLIPIIEGRQVRFKIGSTPPTEVKDYKKGYKRGMSGIFECAFCGTVTKRDYVAEQAMKCGLGSVPLAVVTEGDRSRVYLPVEVIPEPTDLPIVDLNGLDIDLAPNPRDVWCRNFGLLRPVDLFTPRQLVVLTTFSDLIKEIHERIRCDALTAGLSDEVYGLEASDTDANFYADAISVYLALLVNQVTNHSSSLCGWNSANAQMRSVFARQALPMVWDYAESNPFCDSSGSFNNLFERQVKSFSALGNEIPSFAFQADANSQTISLSKVVSTDPPYYDNIGYADLSDFFYVWLRRSLKPAFPRLFATMAVPKAGELVAASYRHGSRELAENFFMGGMTEAMHRLSEQAHPTFPVTIYYAFKQSENEGEGGISSTGWEIFLDAVLKAGFAISGTWPVRTEKQGRVISFETNALASSIVLVCRKRDENSPTATRREFLNALKSELPAALRHLQRGNIAPVDLAQAAIGPGMAIYTRYSKVIDAEGKVLSVHEALTLINQILGEVLAEQEGDFDADSRWALAWFEQFGFAEGEYGVAETLSKAKNTSVSGMVEAGILISKGGKVRLLKPEELPEDWDPENDERLTVWEMVHHLIRVLGTGGESAAAEMVVKLGSKADTARELAYLLYTLCERNKRAQEALAYNSLVQSWPEIMRLSREEKVLPKGQTHLVEED